MLQYYGIVYSYCFLTLVFIEIGLESSVYILPEDAGNVEVCVVLNQYRESTMNISNGGICISVVPGTAEGK